MANIKPKYYSLVVNNDGKEANIYIYGDIVSWEWFENDVSSYTLAKEIEALSKDIATINVYINSYGGEVAEGLAIYNVLRRQGATIKTYCDGFACSIASVIFMAGDERIMSNASLLMIHNAWTITLGDQNQLRKDADDLETITQAAVNAYMDRINIAEEELKELLDAETWLSPESALDKGFATSVVSPAQTNKAVASLRLRKQIAQAVLGMKNPAQNLKANVTVNTTGSAEIIEQIIETVKAEPIVPATEPPADPVPDPPKENKLVKLLTAAIGR